MPVTSCESARKKIKNTENKQTAAAKMLSETLQKCQGNEKIRFYCSFEEQVIRGILRDTVVVDERNSTTSHQKLVEERQCGNSGRIIFQKSAKCSISPPLSFFLEKTLGLSAIKVRKRLDFAHVRRKSESVVREGITSPETYYLLCHSSTSLTVS